MGRIRTALESDLMNARIIGLQIRKVVEGREEEKLHTLEWLASDYVKHLKHHINQIIPRSFDIVYP